MPRNEHESPRDGEFKVSVEDVSVAKRCLAKLAGLKEQWKKNKGIALLLDSFVLLLNSPRPYS
jgi:hypothetical protein